MDFRTKRKSIFCFIHPEGIPKYTEGIFHISQATRTLMTQNPTRVSAVSREQTPEATVASS